MTTHILNNAFWHAIDSLDVDVESIVLMIYSHFSNSAVHTKELKELFSFVDVEQQAFLKHVSTRWLSLRPAVDRLISSWPAVISYFITLGSRCTKAIQTLFCINDENDSDIEDHKYGAVNITLHFVSNLCKVFESASKQL